MPANPAKLVYANGAGHVGPIFDYYVPTQEDVVDNDRVVANTAIMADVSTYHNHIVVADLRRVAWAERTMDSHVFSNRVALSDFEPSRARRR